jgi:hypothetical protein
MSSETAQHRFLLNVWQEEVRPEQVEWRGKLQHLPSGEAHYFRDWPKLIDRLEALLSEHVVSDSPTNPTM